MDKETKRREKQIVKEEMRKQKALKKHYKEDDEFYDRNNELLKERVKKRKNPFKEIRDYGYKVNPLHYLLGILICFEFCVLFHFVFYFGIKTSIPIFATFMVIMPYLMRNHYKNKYELRRFRDVNVYVKQMLYSFKRHSKILDALEDVHKIFPEGEMKTAIADAIFEIKNPTSADYTQIEEGGLAIIERKFKNKNIMSLHSFMLKVEAMGGDPNAAADILLEERELWESRTNVYKGNVKHKRVLVIISVILATGLTAMMLHLFPNGVADEFTNVKEAVATNSTVLLIDMAAIIINLLILTKADSRLAVSLISRKVLRTDDEMEILYEKYTSYDAKKAKVSGAIFAGIFFVVGLVFFLAKDASFVMLLFSLVSWVIGFMMAVFGPLDHALKGFVIKKDLQTAFPEWMSEIGLAIQSDNVQVSIFKSRKTCAGVMRKELDALIQGINDEPDKVEPYLNFFKDFNSSFITTSMQMLYSLSEGTGGNAEEQIATIISEVNKEADRAETKADENSLAGLEMLFLLPTLVASIAMIVQMFCLLFNVF
ncbi:hypothetical protein [Eubacterium oxidoreducens]|uniref:Flp pilus assembly protein TadB n=1 Tax=Eubacterium oxidoreducens TaxID=1732 RepID=A0A1G6B3Y0_EUBOX|nr:hypothetical protein [Eubacterium oxidoreducens]SDB15354.1 hypothetical protein SAMN02910417_01142 [Eubacterium oxidoreducens]